MQLICTMFPWHVHAVSYCFLATCIHLTDPKLIEFWLSLPQAQVDKRGILTLPRNTTFLGNPKQKDCLYVRKCYRQLYDDIVERTTRGASPASRMVITGTPGIGKSQFALYCLWRLSQDGKTVLYQLADTIYHFSGNTVESFSSKAHVRRRLLQDPVSTSPA